MRLDCVYARFYKSFNYDAVRKSHPDAVPDDWDMIDGEFFPYVDIAIDREITAVVGANESGKSHLLGAIRKAITGEGIEQRDLCRYSPFFNVERGRTAWPHLGLKWSSLSNEERDGVKATAAGTPATFDSFYMFREGPDRLRLFFPQRSGKPFEIMLEDHAAHEFGRTFLPVPFDILPGVGLPNAVPLDWLRDLPGAIAPVTRSARKSLLDAGTQVLAKLPGDVGQLGGFLEKLFPDLQRYQAAHREAVADLENPAELNLARDLLVKLANIDPDRLNHLADALATSDDGHANALVARINQQLAKHLNFPKFWVQDRDFSLKVSPREVDLVFTIQDRTGTEYTFAERSHGLKYFLSYLIQAQTREPAADRSEILLMDEPDAFLSAEAQQDLLKIFDSFARPGRDVRPIQVIYVTHSPFLLDKNHAERIRVLQKGRASEGTRAIRNASRNHYEPLRSAFGAFVGETAFVGSCNLLVEGAADQVLLAGASRLIRQRADHGNNESLDLNRIVIVPCGSAGQMPYTVYLVRGRDTEKPPVIALTDWDKAGRDAAKALRGGEKRISRLIKPEYVLDIATVAPPDEDGRQAVEIEDLVPPGLAVRAANAYFKEIEEFRGACPEPFTVEQLSLPLPADRSIFDVLNTLAEERGRHIDKLGFARAVIALCQDEAAQDPDLDRFLDRMRPLFRKLTEQQRAAERDASRAKVSAQVKRLLVNFRRDHPDRATGDQAQNFLEDIQDVLEESRESDAVRSRLMEIRRDFSLDDVGTAWIGRFPEFVGALDSLPHSLEHEAARPRNKKAAPTRKVAAEASVKREGPRAAAKPRGARGTVAPARVETPSRKRKKPTAPTSESTEI